MTRFVAATVTALAVLALTNNGADAFVVRPPTVVAAPSNRYSTAVYDNLFDRFTRVAKANANNILNKLEDPEKVMEQAINDMQVRFSPFPPPPPLDVLCRFGRYVCFSTCV